MWPFRPDTLVAVAYEVQTAVFEGPFDLLLHLVLKSEVDVYEISLSAIVDAFVAELDKLENLDLDVATEFVLVAATLIDLKTRGLLPGRGGDGHRHRRPGRQRRGGRPGQPAPRPADRLRLAASGGGRRLIRRRADDVLGQFAQGPPAHHGRRLLVGDRGEAG